MGAFTVAFISSRQEAPTNPTNALTPNNYTLSLSSDQPNVNFSIDVTPEGGFAVAKHNLTLTTNAPYDINVYVNHKDGNHGDMENLNSTNSIPANSYGSLSMDTWGFAIPSEVSTKSSMFSPTASYESADKNSVFLAISNFYGEDTQYAGNKAIYSGGSKTFPVYYGAYLSLNTFPDGEYFTEIVYTAIVLGNEDYSNPDNIKVTPNPIIKNDNDEYDLLIETSIKTSRTMNNDEIDALFGSGGSRFCDEVTITKNYPDPIAFKCRRMGEMLDGVRIYSYWGYLADSEYSFEYIEPTPMQSFTYQDCDGMSTNQVKYLKDTRDNEVYTVAKLKDGKCWMTQNLRLKLNTSTTLTPANTDISSNWTPPRSTEISNGTGGSSNQGSGAAWNGGSEGYKTVRSIYRTPTYNTHGVYYTHSATAQSANNIDTQGQNAPHSICPKGWRLPTSSNTNGQGEFWQLADKYKGSATWQSNNNYLSGSHTLMQAPASFPLSGNYDYDGYFASVGSGGYWWSSTVYSSYGAYDLNQYRSDLYPHNTNYYNRYWGYSVRCVAR